MITKRIKYLITKEGKAPFEEWFNRLDKLSKVIVSRAVQRVAQSGAKKSIKALKDELFEIKIPHGGGLRVYFVEEGEELIILIAGGNKRTQCRDIEKAKKFWREHGK